MLFFKVIILAFVFIFLNSCGYKPMSYYANKALGKKVYVELLINLANTEDSVRIKDVVNEAIVSRFHSLTTNRDEADSILEVNVNNIQDSVIGTNIQGLATFYRVFVNLSFKFSNNGKTHTSSSQGYYDYAASLSNPAITYRNRSLAIVEAAKQSIDRFVSKIGYSASFL